jgi:hypothetical protein
MFILVSFVELIILTRRGAMPQYPGRLQAIWTTLHLCFSTFDYTVHVIDSDDVVADYDSNDDDDGS